MYIFSSMYICSNFICLLFVNVRKNKVNNKTFKIKLYFDSCKYIHIITYIHIYVYMYIICIYIYVYTYAYVCIYVYMYIIVDIIIEDFN